MSGLDLRSTNLCRLMLFVLCLRCATDCDADADVYFNHHYTKTPEEAVRDVLKAGTDIDCANPGGPGFVGTYAKSALDKGLINEADIDERLRKSFTVRMRLSHFDPIGPLNKIPLTEVCSAATRDVAQEGSRQGAVLIRNELDSMALSGLMCRWVDLLGTDLSYDSKLPVCAHPTDPPLATTR